MKTQINYLDEMIIDNFAGGGGTSTGIEFAVGRPVDIAINHDIDAILMHRTNHPHTLHLCESVWDVDPIRVCAGRKVALAWFSPDCKHFSKAKGGKPRDKNIRGLAWVTIRWAATVKPRVIILENVEEFKTWGPLADDGKPDKKQQGRTFNSFVNALKKHGYEVQWKELKACDYGAPTIRKRFFLVARCDGKPVVFPTATHGIGAGLKPYRTAAEAIDWTLPCPSIFDNSETIKEQYGVSAVRPLAENTLSRIARGIKKFVIDNPSPFIVQVNHSGADWHYCDSIDLPLKTLTAKNGYGVVAPNLIQYHSEQSDKEVRGQAIDRPILTIDATPRYGLVTSNMCVLRNHMDGKDWRQPLPTITTSAGHFAEVRAFLIKYYGQGTGQTADVPLDTVTSKDKFGIVTVQGQNYVITDIGLRMLTPRELYNAQGFPSDYIIDHDYTGKKYPKSKQVARCGNAVPPPFAEALVRANLPELCSKRYETMKQFNADIAI